jgi:hypothetical protein
VTTTVQAIETEYAGCRFRSRLEARWAVFFDKLGAPWEYEAQGFEAPAGRYLPDFWLPTLEMWVEVKGRFEHDDYVKTMCAVPYLTPQRSTGQAKLLILGPVPAPGEAWVQSRIDACNPDQILLQTSYFRHWSTGMTCNTIDDFVPMSITRIASMTADESAGRRAELTNEYIHPCLRLDRGVDDAYRAARSARFEFGERG